MKYKDYELNDFLKDDYFIQWVTNAQNGSNHFWDNWIRNHPEKNKVVAEAKQLILSFNYRNSFELNEKEYTDLLEGILRDEIKGRKKNSNTKWLTNRANFRWIGWAAAIIIISFGVYSSSFIEEKSIEKESTTITYIDKNTSRGQKSSIKLKDGTVVKLNSNSAIRFPETFSNTERVVYMEGEAFFDVAKDASRPFTVVTGGIKTTALGTSFNVKSSNNVENVKVALVSGKVEVKDDHGSAVILRPSEMVTYNEGIINKRLFDYDKEVAWIDGKLYFNEQTLNKVFEELEEWYGFDCEFDLSTPIKGKYSGEFANNPSLERVMDGISYASNFNYEIIGNKILISN
jgi:transmembrane sensor